MSKDTVVSSLRGYPGIYLEVVSKKTKKKLSRITGVQAEIWTQDLLKTKQEL